MLKGNNKATPMDSNQWMAQTGVEMLFLPILLNLEQFFKTAILQAHRHVQWSWVYKRITFVGKLPFI